LFNHACQKWERFKNNILITEKGSLSISQIRSTVKRIKRKHKIDLVAVDYIQIIQTRDQKNLNEATLIKENVTALKEIAKEFNVVMVALSQITKDALGGRPGLKSLKGSGGIAEGADTVINMWTDSDQEQEGQKNKNLNMEIAKNRNGICGTLSVNFDGEFGIFSEQNIKQQF
jgi:replicative DNA helicase